MNLGVEARAPLWRTKDGLRSTAAQRSGPDDGVCANLGAGLGAGRFQRPATLESDVAISRELLVLEFVGKRWRLAPRRGREVGRASAEAAEGMIR